MRVPLASASVYVVWEYQARLRVLKSRMMMILSLKVKIRWKFVMKSEGQLEIGGMYNVYVMNVDGDIVEVGGCNGELLSDGV